MKNENNFRTSAFCFMTILVVFLTNAVSNAQINSTSPRKGLYYSDTITDSPKHFHLYMFNIGNYEESLEIVKIDIERIDSVETVKSSTDQFPPHTFKFSMYKRKSKSFMYNTFLKKIDGLKDSFEVTNSLNDSLLLKISFTEEFINIYYTKLRDFQPNLKLYHGITYYENGDKQSLGGYWKGKKHGRWMYYDETGLVITTKDFLYGYDVTSDKHD